MVCKPPILICFLKRINVKFRMRFLVSGTYLLADLNKTDNIANYFFHCMLQP